MFTTILCLHVYGGFPFQVFVLNSFQSVGVVKVGNLLIKACHSELQWSLLVSKAVTQQCMVLSVLFCAGDLVRLCLVKRRIWQVGQSVYTPVQPSLCTQGYHVHVVNTRFSLYTRLYSAKPQKHEISNALHIYTYICVGPVLTLTHMMLNLQKSICLRTTCCLGLQLNSGETRYVSYVLCIVS